MIRIAVISKRYQYIIDQFKTTIYQDDIHYTIEPYHQTSCYDIYFIEIEKRQDLKILDILKRTDETLIYIIGPKDFDLAHLCIQYQVHLYLIKEQLKEELVKYQEHILKHIQERFQYYTYQKRGMSLQIRLSQIYYVESLRHRLIIHCLEGDFEERKNLREFLKQISSKQFVQIHKSYIVNRQYIHKINQQDMILKNQICLPIGKTFKKAIM